MAEDPLATLLRQHFKKVNECLLDKENLDILTKSSLRSTCDKAIDDNDINTDEEYLNAEFELSQKVTEDSFQDLSIVSDMSVFESEELQAETSYNDFKIRKGDTETSSSVYSYSDDMEEYSDDNKSVILNQKLSRNSLSDRPQTPVLDLYDSEEGNEICDVPRKIESSQKFVLNQEPFQAGDQKGKVEESEAKVEKPEVLELLPRKEERIIEYNIPSPEENERAFQEELEMYKKDIELEKTIENNRRKFFEKQSSYSCSQYQKKFPSCDFKDIKQKPNVPDNCCYDFKQEKSPVYIKNYFEEENTNVCKKTSQQDQNFNFSDHPEAESFMDFSINGKQDELFHDEFMLPTNNYVTVNHLEIQKEMVRRIEEMYKPGDSI